MRGIRIHHPCARPWKSILAEYGTNQGGIPTGLPRPLLWCSLQRQMQEDPSTWFENNVRNYIIPLTQRLPLIIASMVPLCDKLKNAAVKEMNLCQSRRRMRHLQTLSL